MKKFIRATALSFIYLSSLNPCLAQSNAQDIIEGKEYPLNQISAGARKVLVESGEGLVCGKYFYMTDRKPMPTPGKYSLIAFTFINADSYIFQIMGWDKFIVYIDDTKKFPTASPTKKLGPRDPLSFHWIIRISNKDLETAQPCLPKPTL